MRIVNDKFVKRGFFFVNWKVFLLKNLSKYHSMSVGAYNNFSVRARVSYEAFQVFFLLWLSYQQIARFRRRKICHYIESIFHLLKKKTKLKRVKPNVRNKLSIVV